MTLVLFLCYSNLYLVLLTSLMNEKTIVIHKYGRNLATVKNVSKQLFFLENTDKPSVKVTSLYQNCNSFQSL